MKNKTKLFGESGFNQFYSELFGARWETLKESFFQENQSVEYKIEDCESYFLDSASVFAALCLPLENAQNILDLCAAPGGKTLVLASRMPNDAKLFSNERSASRVNRLKKVVQTCLPESINQRVKVSCSDGATWCKKQLECYDRILLDAPCSSERHVIQDKKYLDSWSPSRIKTVSMEQWALLSSAYRLLEVGGILLYSTCALCPQENDEIIAKLQKKFNKDGKSFEFLQPEPNIKEIENFTNIKIPNYEKTEFGYHILPDVQNGAGPIYFSIIKKIKLLNEKS